MCGHGIIALSTVMAETGWIDVNEPVTEIKIDSPAGQIRSFVHVEDGSVDKVSFLNVPSFVVELDCKVHVEGIGEVTYDLVFGGAFYAYVKASSVSVVCRPENVRELIEKGMMIKRAIMSSREIKHPFDDDLGFLYGTIFVDGPQDPNHHSRNVCVFAEGEVDRSPTGTGVSGRLALHYARGELELGQQITIESIIGSTFNGEVTEETDFGGYSAVIPRVEGTAHITGRHEFLIDPADPLKDGFFLR